MPPHRQHAHRRRALPGFLGQDQPIDHFVRRPVPADTNDDIVAIPYGLLGQLGRMPGAFGLGNGVIDAQSVQILADGGDGSQAGSSP